MPVCTVYYKNLLGIRRQVKERYIVDEFGDKNGLYQSYYKNGQEKERFIYRNNIPQGEYIRFHDNGRVATEGFKKNGQWEGAFCSYFPDETPHVECTYKDGVIVGESKIYNENRQMCVRDHRDENGDLNGLCESWDIGCYEQTFYEHGKKKWSKIYSGSIIESQTVGYPRLEKLDIALFDTLDIISSSVYQFKTADGKTTYNCKLGCDNDTVLRSIVFDRQGRKEKDFKSKNGLLDEEYCLFNDEGIIIEKRIYDAGAIRRRYRYQTRGFTSFLKDECGYDGKGRFHGDYLEYDSSFRVVKRVKYNHGQIEVNPLMKKLDFEKRVDKKERDSLAEKLKQIKQNDKNKAYELAHQFHSASADVPRRTALKFNKTKTRA